MADLFETYRKSHPDFLDDFLAPEGIITRKRDIDDRIIISAKRVSEARKSLKKLIIEKQNLTEKISDYKSTLGELRISKARMTTQLAALQDSMKVLGREIDEQDIQIKENLAQQNHDQNRLKALREKVHEQEVAGKNLHKNKEALKKNLETLEKTISTRNRELSGKEHDLKSRIDTMERYREMVEKIHISQAQIDTEIQNIYDYFREKNSKNLHNYLDRL